MTVSENRTSTFYERSHGAPAGQVTDVAGQNVGNGLYQFAKDEALGGVVGPLAGRVGSKILNSKAGTFITGAIGEGAEFIQKRLSGGAVQEGLEKLAVGFCFIGGTTVLTNNGFVAIENIAIGDTVLTYSEDKKINEWRAVLQISKNTTKELAKIVIKKDTIFATPGHRFFTDSGWIQASNLNANLGVKLSDSGFAKVTSVSFIDTTTFVYNLEVDENHNYFITTQKLLVHNGCVDDILALEKSGNFEQFYKKLNTFDFGTYLEKGLGIAKPSNMYRAHAHHIVMKAATDEFSVKSRALLKKYGIDPYFGKENFVWAPNADGNHSLDTAKAIYNSLKGAEDKGGDSIRDSIIETLRTLGEKAGKSEFKN